MVFPSESLWVAVRPRGFATLELDLPRGKRLQRSKSKKQILQQMLYD
jgi:hypothetical protein